LAASAKSRTATSELNYIGTHGTNLPMRRIAQAFPYDPAHPLSVDARKSYPNFVVYRQRLSGRSNYNALNTKLEHRCRLDSDVGTWAKSTDSSRRRLESARAGSTAGRASLIITILNGIVACRTSTSISDWSELVYNFRRGGKVANDATGVKEALVGGWQLNGIYTWQHGFPITITAADLGPERYVRTNRVNLVGVHGGSADRDAMVLTAVRTTGAR
jgi:hypothetical protein